MIETLSVKRLIINIYYTCYTLNSGTNRPKALRERRTYLLANNTEGKLGVVETETQAEGKKNMESESGKRGFVISKNKHKVSVDVSRILSTTIVSITTLCKTFHIKISLLSMKMNLYTFTRNSFSYEWFHTKT